jgi:iron(III) transport system ATP-binding protein
VRPQNLRLHARGGAGAGGTGARAPSVPERLRLVPALIVQRAYLGEHWDYLVRMEGTEEPLRVTTLPHERFELQQAVWLEIDPAHLVPIA